MIWEVTVQVDPDQAELLEDFLTESGREDWHIYSAADERLASLTGYFGSEDEARAAWQELKGAFPSEVGKLRASYRQVGDADWQEAYKAHFHPWRFEGLHWVPIWEKETFDLPEGEQVVWLDPGLAFGTGNHETTRLCVERLLECCRIWRGEGRNLKDLQVLDAGCGSGILAISAAKSGFGHVGGFDLDPVAVEVSEENAELNGLLGQIEFFQGDLVTGLDKRSADLLVANIQADVLCHFAGELAGAVRPGGRLILSGILAKEISEVEHCFRNALPEAEFSSRQLGEWADLLAVTAES